MQLSHRAVVVGCALAVTLGAAPQAVFAVDADVAATAQDQVGRLPEPAAYDKADFYEDAADGRSIELLASSLSPVYLSDEMKYFTKYESHSNYDQGFSYGDGYNALGYYQFDRRYSLVGFMTDVYNYDPATYGMFAAVIARGSELSDGSVSLYDSETGKLTEIGQLAEDAWHAAYAANPREFSALQDAWAYNNYYAVSERWLRNNLGIDMTQRADCVKGLVWSMTNLFGAGGVRDFFNYASLRNDMTDREMVNALVDAIVNNIVAEYPNQTQYHKGWISRYERERADCLAYIEADEAQDGGSGTPAPPAEPEEPSQPETPSTPEVPNAGIETLSSFADYDATAWYAVNPDDLSYTVSHGFMSGYADGSGEFGFEKAIKRGEVVVILWRMAGCPKADARDFIDVDYDEFYGDAIEWARYVGVVSGFSSASGSLNIFGPDMTITRQELAVMLMNYASKVGRLNTSSNLAAASSMSGWDKVGSWAQAAMGWAVDKKIITGSVFDGVAQLLPEGTATRAQAGVMVARLYRDVLS